MRITGVLLLAALIAAPACGGGGGGGTDPGGSPSPLSASFTPDQPSPGSATAAMAEGAKSSDVVTVNVTLTGTNNVFASAFEVVYDSANTVYVGYVRGTAFEQGGDAPNYTVDGTTNPGRIYIGVARTSGTTTNVSATKTMIGLQLRVRRAGVYPVGIENAAVYDGQVTPQPIPGIAWFAGAVSGV